VAGLAAAAAHAYRTGDAHAVQRLRLDPDALLGLEDEFEVLRRVVDRACGSPASTIEDHERRLIAADVADWILGHDYSSEHGPAPVTMARYAITVIVATVLLTECGHVLNAHPLAELGEAGIRDTAALAAAGVPLHVPTASETDLIAGIDTGLVVLGGTFAETG
jgi:hypothetical protein